MNELDLHVMPNKNFLVGLIKTVIPCTHACWIWPGMIISFELCAKCASLAIYHLISNCMLSSSGRICTIMNACIYLNI